MTTPSSRTPAARAQIVLISGHEYFAKRLVKDLSEHDSGNSYRYLSPLAGLAGRVRGAFAIFRADIFYVLGGTVARNRVVDLALFLGKTVVMHWVGSDVTAAVEVQANGGARGKSVARVIHWCEVDWIQGELKRIGIDARLVPIAALDEAAGGVKEFPERFAVLSYVREGREQFYGMDDLLRLAEDFPEVGVRIAGISAYDRPLPRNVALLGWKEDMLNEYHNTVLYLRLPEHDGLSFSVLEALAHGRYVGYSYEYPHTLFIDSYARLRETAGRLLERFRAGSLRVNEAGVAFVKAHFNRARVLEELAAALMQARAQRAG